MVEAAVRAPPHPDHGSGKTMLKKLIVQNEKKIILIYINLEIIEHIHSKIEIAHKREFSLYMLVLSYF